MSATVSAQFGGFFKDAKKYARQRERDETITVEQKRHYDNVIRHVLQKMIYNDISQRQNVQISK